MVKCALCVFQAVSILRPERNNYYFPDEIIFLNVLLFHFILWYTKLNIANLY